MYLLNFFVMKAGRQIRISTSIDKLKKETTDILKKHSINVEFGEINGIIVIFDEKRNVIGNIQKVKEIK